MSKRDWRLFINDILECIERIEKYVSGLSYDDFGNANFLFHPSFINFSSHSQAPLNHNLLNHILEFF